MNQKKEIQNIITNEIQRWPRVLSGATLDYRSAEPKGLKHSRCSQQTKRMKKKIYSIKGG